MKSVFKNVYLLVAMAETDPSLEFFFKLMVASPLFARFVRANRSMRDSLYALHRVWLKVERTQTTKPVIVVVAGRQVVRIQGVQKTTYTYPVTKRRHRIGAPAVSTITSYPYSRTLLSEISRTYLLNGHPTERDLKRKHESIMKKTDVR